MSRREKEEADGTSFCPSAFSFLGTAPQHGDLLPSESAALPATPATPGLRRWTFGSQEIMEISGLIFGDGRSSKATFLCPSEDIDPSHVSLAFCHHRCTKCPQRRALPQQGDDNYACRHSGKKMLSVTLKNSLCGDRGRPGNGTRELISSHEGRTSPTVMRPAGQLHGTQDST